MNALNHPFETEFKQEDEGYESGSESFNVPTPLSRALRIYHVTTVADLFFNPANFGQSPTTQDQHAKSSHCRYGSSSITHHQLVFTSTVDKTPMRHSEQHSKHSYADDSSHNPWEADTSYSVHFNLCHPTNLFLTDD